MAGGAAGGREHRVAPGDTLPGLALRYGVTMEQIKRANRLYTSDPVFLKPTLLIPLPEQPGGLCPEEDPPGTPPPDPGDTDATTSTPSRHDLSATDFLRHLDAEIGRSKAAAARRLRAGGTGVTEAEGTRPPEVAVTSRGPRLGPRPLTRTRRAAALRDAEDEIFTL